LTAYRAIAQVMLAPNVDASAEALVALDGLLTVEGEGSIVACSGALGVGHALAMRDFVAPVRARLDQLVRRARAANSLHVTVQLEEVLALVARDERDAAAEGRHVAAALRSVYSEEHMPQDQVLSVHLTAAMCADVDSPGYRELYAAGVLGVAFARRHGRTSDPLLEVLAVHRVFGESVSAVKITELVSAVAALDPGPWMRRQGIDRRALDEALAVVEHAPRRATSIFSDVWGTLGRAQETVAHAALGNPRARQMLDLMLEHGDPDFDLVLAAWQAARDGSGGFEELDEFLAGVTDLVSCPEELRPLVQVLGDALRASDRAKADVTILAATGDLTARYLAVGGVFASNISGRVGPWTWWIETILRGTGPDSLPRDALDAPSLNVH
jgi:hypothetical protein